MAGTGWVLPVWEELVEYGLTAAACWWTFRTRKPAGAAT